MRKSFHWAAWMILVAVAAGAAAPKKAADKPATVSEELRKIGIDLKAKMTQADVQAALDKAKVKVIEKIPSQSDPEMIFWILDNGIDLGLRGGILKQAGRKTPPTNSSDSKPSKSEKPEKPEK